MLVTSHATATMFDKKKGSLTNRWECAREHMKNDFKTETKVLLAGGTVASIAALAERGRKAMFPPAVKVPESLFKTATKTGAEIKKVSKLTKIMNRVGKFMYIGLDKIGSAIGVFANKIGAKNISEKLLRNPANAGFAAVAIIGTAYALTKIAQYFTNKGRIDQKYEDAAKIESQTKNIVLAKMQAMQEAEELGYTA